MILFFALSKSMTDFQPSSKVGRVSSWYQSKGGSIDRCFCGCLDLAEGVVVGRFGFVVRAAPADFLAMLHDVPKARLLYMKW